MSRQVQIRRGTAAEHANFTGAAGELTFDGQTLRVHDGTTPGGIILARADDLSGTGVPETADYVIETQLPTAENNYTWYRKYASGWVEQGGRANITLSANGANTTIALVQKMQNTYYTAIASLAGTYGGRTLSVQKNLLSTEHIIVGGYVTSGSETNSCFWHVYGMSE